MVLRSQQQLDTLACNRADILGGISSSDRIIDSALVYIRGYGAGLRVAHGNHDVDYRAAFGPYFFLHKFALVNQAAISVTEADDSLFGAGLSSLQRSLASSCARSFKRSIK